MALDPDLLKKANITIVRTLDEALALVYTKHGKDLKTHVMPMGRILYLDLHKVILGHGRKGVIEKKISTTPFLYDYVYSNECYRLLSKMKA